MGKFKIGQARSFGRPPTGGRFRALPPRLLPPAIGPFYAKVREGDPRVTTIYGAGGKHMCHVSTAQCNVNSKATIDWLLGALNAAWNIEANIQAAETRFQYEKPESFNVTPKGSKFP